MKIITFVLLLPSVVLAQDYRIFGPPKKPMTKQVARSAFGMPELKTVVCATQVVQEQAAKTSGYIGPIAGLRWEPRLNSYVQNSPIGDIRSSGVPTHQRFHSTRLQPKPSTSQTTVARGFTVAPSQSSALPQLVPSQPNVTATVRQQTRTRPRVSQPLLRCVGNS